MILMMNKIKNKIKKIKKIIGNTPIIKLENKKNNNNIYAETTNFSGSIKDRPVNSIYLMEYLIMKLIKYCNYRIKLGKFCNFMCIALFKIEDQIYSYYWSFINRLNHDLLKQLCEEVIMIDEIDETGGYLLNRIKKSKRIIGWKTKIITGLINIIILIII